LIAPFPDFAICLLVFCLHPSKALNFGRVYPLYPAFDAKIFGLLIKSLLKIAENRVKKIVVYKKAQEAARIEAKLNLQRRTGNALELI